MDSDEIKHLRDLRREHQKVLKQYEIQYAKLGLYAPPHILIAIDELKEKIAGIDAQLLANDAENNAALVERLQSSGDKQGQSKLTRNEYKQLHDALLDAFDRASLTRMLRFELDRKLDRLVACNSLTQEIFDLIDVAEREKWVRELVVAARAANEGNRELAAFAERFLAEHAIEKEGELAAQLHVNRPIPQITATLQQSRTMFDQGGLCQGVALKPLPDRYFIAQEFNASKDDLRDAIEKSLSSLGYQSIRADDFIGSGALLCKISALIQRTPFGVYQLSRSQNRNVYLELGIALGLGRPFVLVKDRQAKVARLAQGLEYYQINSYLETRYELGGLLQEYVTEIGEFRPKTHPPATQTQTAVIAHGNVPMYADFTITVGEFLKQRGYKAVILAEYDAKLADYLSQEGIEYEFATTLDETVSAIQAARIGFYRVESSADANAFIAFGIAMSQNSKGVLIRRDTSSVPTDLKGLNVFSFSDFRTLNDNFARWVSL